MEIKEIRESAAWTKRKYKFRAINYKKESNRNFREEKYNSWSKKNHL